jgi:RNA polymerase sigma factor (sigma-70 family)
VIRTYAAPPPAPPPVRSARLEAAARANAFETLFEAEYPRVVAIASRILGGGAEAEDVAQEVFLQFHRGQDPLAGFAAAWLHAGAAHAALNVIRARHRRAARERQWAAEPGRSDDPADQALAADTRRRVRDALSRVRRRDAAILALRYAGLSYAEVAEATGTRVAQVGTRLRRAEAALRREIGDAPI